MKNILALASETSSWRGLIMIFTALGVHIEPGQENAIISVGLAIVGAIGTFFPDKVSTSGS